MEENESFQTVFGLFDGQKEISKKKNKKSWQKEKKEESRKKTKKIRGQNKEKKNTPRRSSEKKKEKVKILYRLSNDPTHSRKSRRNGKSKKNNASKQNAIVFSKIERLVDKIKKVWEKINSELTFLLASQNVSDSIFSSAPSPSPTSSPLNKVDLSPSMSLPHWNSRDLRADYIDDVGYPQIGGDSCINNEDLVTI